MFNDNKYKLTVTAGGKYAKYSEERTIYANNFDEALEAAKALIKGINEEKIVELVLKEEEKES